MSKVNLVELRNVGATCADVLAYREIAEEIVLIGHQRGNRRGKALDIFQKAPDSINYDSRTVGQHKRYFQKQANFGCSSNHFRSFQGKAGMTVIDF